MDRTPRWLVGLGAVGALVQAEEFLPLDPPLRMQLAVMSLATAVGVARGSRAGAVVSLLTWIFAASLAPQHLHAGLFFFCAALWFSGRRSLQGAMAGLGAGVVVLELAGFLPQLADAQARVVTGLVGVGDLGAGLLGARPAILATLFVLIGAAARRSWLVAGAALAVHAAAAVLTVAGFDAHGVAEGRLPWFVALPLLAQSALAVLAWSPVATRPAEGEPIRGRVPLLAASIAAIVCTLASRPLGASGARGEVTFLSEGGLDWDVPTIGKYGDFSSGMFGLLPHYLARASIDCRFATWSAALWARSGVVVMINNGRVCTDSERAHVCEFLERGGNLLILADHTDVFGLQRGFNSIVGPLGCSLEFDSAYPVGGDWQGKVAVRLPFAMPNTTRGFVPGHAIGCSLNVNAAWERMLVGVHAFGDAGVRENEQGSYLGDYSHDDDEPVGDMCLAAWRRVGKGTVAVYGDTSAFQNSGLRSTFLPHVLPLFQWLTGEKNETLLRFGVGASLVAGAVAVPLLTGSIAVWLAVAIALSCAVGISRVSSVSEAAQLRALDQDGLVLVDNYRQPNTGHYDARWNCVGPLYTDLLRSGFWVLDAREPLSYREQRCSAIVWIGTRLAGETSGIVADMLQYEANGGVLVLASGYEDCGPVTRDVLAAHGAEVKPTALGAIEGPAGEKALAPSFVDAWPLHLDGEHRRLAHAGDHTLAAFVPHGKGGCFAIADTRFFSSGNIEGDGRTHAGNTAFLLSTFPTLLRQPRTPVARPADNPPKQ